MVFIGHSMGGVIARLMLSDSGDTLWNGAVERFNLHGERLRRVEAAGAADPLFAAAGRRARGLHRFPHRGTDIAGDRLGRLIGVGARH